MFQLKKAVSDMDIRELENMAKEIWHEYFPAILSEEQIVYMLEHFQSFRAIKEQIHSQNFTYYFIQVDENIAGYTAIQAEVDKMFLSKLYLYGNYRGKGYARMTMEQLQKISMEQGKHAIHLTVKRNNERAISAYKKLGFVITGTRDADIGQGFVMDDYLMELTW